ncbi:MAG TPA: hypothetical protein VG298_08075 [Acidimicrobiales bacterium]|nr:hypothetical protein [Acidimicrobiales bacterium]
MRDDLAAPSERPSRMRRYRWDGWLGWILLGAVPLAVLGLILFASLGFSAGAAGGCGGG